jgi:SAM-dependent methyltransferase
MGRRGVRIEDAERWVFNRLAGDYRARPGYPPELLDRLAELAGGPGGAAVDLGAGTGLVALALASRGLQVVAVEPAEEMLRVVQEAAEPRVLARHAAAEATGLAGRTADLAVLADALHWVDPGAVGLEVARVLRPGGVVAVVEAAPSPTPFMTGVIALVEAANFKARRSSSAAVRREHLLRAAGASSPAVSERFQHSEPLAPARLDAVLRSLSLVGPAIGEAAVEHLLAEVRRLAESAGGAVWARDLTLTWARRPGPHR